MLLKKGAEELVQAFPPVEALVKHPELCSQRWLRALGAGDVGGCDSAPTRAWIPAGSDSAWLQ